MNEMTISETIAADAIAEKYRRDGYQVSRESQLEFAPGVRADLVVRKDDEVKVIEIKSRSSLAASSETSEIARMVRARPGWTFELVLVGESEIADSPRDAHAVRAEGVVQRLDEAERALEEGLEEAAFLLAWSACEAALRALVVEEGVSGADVTAPDRVFDHAVFNGVISRPEYQSLVDMRQLRNAIVHGFTVDGFGADAVTDLIDIVRRLTGATTPRDD